MSAATTTAPAPPGAAQREGDLLRVSTAGSVDDGKSTLIGRLLFDTKSIFEDQLLALEGASRRRGDDGLNLALLTDGLRAEREQNITIDVAYRYFATPRRKFIVADTPGHVQYTRNMVTGASTADLAIVLVDARRGAQTQSRRHGFIASLLRIPHVVVAVNKMDMVGYDQAVFDEIVAEFRGFAEKLDVKDLVFIPLSALHGDNVVAKSDAMPWYQGATLLHHLENVNVGAERNLVDFRFPVQYVLRPHQDFRGFAGRVASGTVSAGEEVVVLPSGRATRVRSVETADGPRAEGAAGDSVILTLDDDVDVSRGDMIVRRNNLPTSASRIDALVCWLSESPLDPSTPYLLMHTTRTVRAFVQRVAYRIDVDTLHREPAASLGLNDIGRVELQAAAHVFFDPYALNRATGSFILVHPYTHATVAAGMIRGEVKSAEALAAAPAPAPPVSPGVVWEEANIPREAREARNGHAAAVVWLTGLSGAGKSTIARALERHLFARGCQTMLLDGDQLRHGLCGDLGFTPADRAENVRRAGEAARLFFESGALVLCTFVSPFAADRDRARSLVPEGRFVEVFVDCPLPELRRRDTKGLYARAERGELHDLTGVTAPYEPPTAAELVVRSDAEGVDAAVARIVAHLEGSGVLRGAAPGGREGGESGSGPKFA
ncbi:MAG TPA: sulfate adenylyltransferase subunit CysN [Longimicrobium sp.]|uniref:sulfate adenylyltransferase subunit CysN n=1 Tax=Longimicrobium sp. TaxID=2029185 RepID=UPI002EDBB7A1